MILRTFATAILPILILVNLPLGAKSQPILPSEAPPVLTAPPIEAIQTPDGNVTPVNGSVTVKLINKTNARIKFQFLGNLGTRQTILEGQAESRLFKLSLPISLTFRRIDNGFLKVDLRTRDNGLLEVEFDLTADFNVDRISLWVSPSGEIYLN
ncbi:hypothetical protein Syn7502_00467 [Synechococcus sp. PCC 7502]|nr:hypothetical protein Syn7502_00467 [Synechococcus sp. PCC 7502]